jgi:hypothetical protein
MVLKVAHVYRKITKGQCQKVTCVPIAGEAGGKDRAGSTVLPKRL